MKYNCYSRAAEHIYRLTFQTLSIIEHSISGLVFSITNNEENRLTHTPPPYETDESESLGKNSLNSKGLDKV